MGVTDDEFYDVSRIAIVPMGFCFPGLDAKGGDLPPRRECAPLWRAPLMAVLPDLDLVLLVGQYAQRWHLGAEARSGLTDIVQRWREIAERPGRPILVPLPHPSWRNNGWIRRHPWFEGELLPWLREAVRKRLRA
jgi:uracil-DNA glycosylase